jgi:hypothetical protein
MRTDGQPVPGDTLGPWVVLERLDAGSFGTTYRCKRAGHPAAGDFCLKLARNPKDRRFEREGELLQLGLPGQPKSRSARRSKRCCCASSPRSTSSGARLSNSRARLWLSPMRPGKQRTSRLTPS